MQVLRENLEQRQQNALLDAVDLKVNLATARYDYIQLSNIEKNTERGGPITDVLARHEGHRIREYSYYWIIRFVEDLSLIHI